MEKVIKAAYCHIVSILLHGQKGRANIRTRLFFEENRNTVNNVVRWGGDTYAMLEECGKPA